MSARRLVLGGRACSKACPFAAARAEAPVDCVSKCLTFCAERGCGGKGCFKTLRACARRGILVPRNVDKARSLLLRCLRSNDEEVLRKSAKFNFGRSIEPPVVILAGAPDSLLHALDVPKGRRSRGPSKKGY